MSQRDSGYDRKARDLYETPEWVTQALLPFVPRLRTVWEPACGSGKMVDVLRTQCRVMASDKEPAAGARTWDFLSDDCGPDWYLTQDAIITNPPYDQADAFIATALHIMKQSGGLVAMLLSNDFDHAKSRAPIFADHPAFAMKIILRKRITWFEQPKIKGVKRQAPSGIHAWFVWDWQNKNQPTIRYAP